MCGRYQTPTDIKKIEEAFDIKINKKIYKANFNASPAQILPLITNNNPDQLQFFRWGLIPHWAKDMSIGYKMINARIETLDEKPSFKYLVKKNRCIIITDGYYEWKKIDSKTKQPMRICKNNFEFFTFAGLWTQWKDQENNIIPSFTIITTDAYKSLNDIHNRMPVMLNPEIARKWLMNELELNQLQKEIISSKELISYPISTLVNNPKNNSPELTDKI